MSESKKQIVKADSRGYAYLGKLEGAPDFSKLSKAARLGQPGTPIQALDFNGEGKPNNMLKKGYVAVGANAEVEVEFKANGIEITPMVEA
jgi:hypothetical protein